MAVARKWRHALAKRKRIYTGRVSLPLSGQEIVAFIVAVSFAAGLNVYATVATLGLLAHTGFVDLPGSLDALSNWWIIGASGALFAVEFFADKIPGFDLIWNALHTFIRIPVAALLAYRATSTLTPLEHMTATLAGGLIAFAAHGGKTAARAVITPSPEPLSNIGLSLGEDVVAITLTWLATRHPVMAITISILLVLIVILLIRRVWRAVRTLFRRARRVQQSRTGISDGN